MSPQYIVNIFRTLLLPSSNLVLICECDLLPLSHFCIAIVCSCEMWFVIHVLLFKIVFGMVFAVSRKNQLQMIQFYFFFLHTRDNFSHLQDRNPYKYSFEQTCQRFFVVNLFIKWIFNHTVEKRYMFCIIQIFLRLH